ncbi:hypothetical protein OEB99_05975 [Actinotalea sp. M2MS4P-6]|uniref:nitrogenase component 1 n=1 Tax=Actinotalea sp. M2MS4P-6 TaxID=2983762 RepID=UPI0021E44208|nr:nitrogenase component 1 [Actinotalea sp. M2MS4P-6]MCV2393850.1 hypothetical protein [Actinotalea sp. M2MS4P-6]
MALADTARVAAPTPVRSVSTTNACRMCMPLGASLALAGFEGTVPFLHGSQGCATYIRRYLISHFREPMDIASSSIAESSTVFGGESALVDGIANVARVYRPAMIGVATTCLTETIGEDVGGALARIDGCRPEPADPAADGSVSPTGAAPALVHVSTPAYAGTHVDGYQAAVAATVGALAEPGAPTEQVVVLPGLVSPADLRHLREVVDGFGLSHLLVPDISDRLDAGVAEEYQRLPPGGTPLAEAAAACRARAAVTLGGLVSPGTALAGELLEDRFGVAHHRLALPIGIRLTDALVETLEGLGGTAPHWLDAERGRLVDAYVDGHKYLAERTAVLFGDEDLVLGLAVWLAEIGVTPAACVTGGRSGRLAAELVRLAPELDGRVTVVDDGDFAEVEELVRALSPDLLVGHSRGYPLSRALDVPLVRVGLPIHDRVGAARTRHLGYRGTQELFDRVTNALIERRQDESAVGYAYM